jgi:hypothetical protein
MQTPIKTTYVLCTNTYTKCIKPKKKHIFGLFFHVPFLRDVDALTRLVLVNALYFKALWQAQFDPQLTIPGLFSPAGGGPQVRVPFMRRRMVAWLRQDPVHEVTMLELPYSDGNTSMLIILPYEGSRRRNADAIFENLIRGNGRSGPFKLDPRSGKTTKSYLLNFYC